MKSLAFTGKAISEKDKTEIKLHQNYFEVTQKFRMSGAKPQELKLTYSFFLSFFFKEIADNQPFLLVFSVRTYTDTHTCSGQATCKIA